MGEAYFYHLTRQTVDQALLPLLSKCLSNSWRVVIRGHNPQAMASLNDKLWQGPSDTFVPHGLAGDAGEADQPILLTIAGQSYPHDCLICIDGADVSAQEVEKAKRVCVVFQNENRSDMQTARNQWKSLTQAGLAAKYWSQAQGSWELQAQKAAV